MVFWGGLSRYHREAPSWDLKVAEELTREMSSAITPNQPIVTGIPDRCWEVLPPLSSHVEALSPFSAPTAHLISCSGSNIWWPVGSHIGKALPLNPPAAPGWRWWSCLNLAFLLQRESSGKENEAERPLVASWEGRGTKVGEKHEDEEGVQVKLMICLLTSHSICQPCWRQNMGT